MNKNFILGAVLLMTGCATQQLPSVIDMPYCDANNTLPCGVELTQIERTDSTTELTFMAMYEYYDVAYSFGNDVKLIGDGVDLPLKEVKSIGNTVISGYNVMMQQGVPAQFKMIFPALPEDITTVDLIQKRYGKFMEGYGGEVINLIWGIDLTGKRSANELPSEIPAKLIKPDFTTGKLPQIVRKDGVAKIKAHAVAWRDWMDNRIDFIVNTIDDEQEIIKTKFNKDGVVTVEIPLKGTAIMAAHTPYIVYSDFYVDPGEEINLYILPTNRSDAQRFIRPNGITDGKYRNIMAMRDKMIFFFNEFADTLLLDKTNTDDYFAAMMKIHSNGLDSIKARNFEPDLEKYARAAVDRQLMYQAFIPDAYTPRNWDERDAAKPDSVLRFSPEQIKQIRSSIDFSNPLLELRSIGNPGTRTMFLKAKELILAE